MRLATIEIDGGLVPAALLEGDVALPLPFPSIQALIEGGDPALAKVRAAVAAGGASIPAGSYALRAPIPRPLKNVFCVGRNYAEHIAEGDRAQKQSKGVSEQPIFFTKPPTSVIGPNEPGLVFPSVSTAYDYEVELAVVIGKPGRNIPRERAMEHVFGYCVLNDLTVRDVQRRHGGQFFKGKAFDNSCPIGPWLVTADAVPNPHGLAIKLWVNGELRQNGVTSDMIFDIPTLIASLSEGLTLESGDILATGTPSGVGYAMEPPRWLADGDVVVCEVDGLGRLETPIRAAAA